MSAVSAVLTADAIVFAADGATYDAETGIVGGFVSKIFTVPHLDLIYAHVGIGGFGVALLHNIGTEFNSFDEVLEGIVAKCRETYSIMQFQGLTQGARATVVFGGWSDTRSAFEVYKVHSSEKDAYDATGALVTHAPWVLHRIETAWASSTPDADRMAEFGLTSGQHFATDYAARMVCANRGMSGTVNPGDGVYGVGGFLEMAVLQRGQVRRWIAHRWPDPIGEPIDPRRGDPMPAMPIPVP